MKKFLSVVNTILLISSVLALGLGILVIVKTEILILGCLLLAIGFIGFKIGYQNFVVMNRKRNKRYSQLTAEELELIEDAKQLIKSVNQNIVISDFNVYKIRFLWKGWFYYDTDTQELCIFLPFKRFMKFGKDFCFLTLVHEVLHSQNLKENIMICDIDFLEGLNQLLTTWLIENYSQKYSIPKQIAIITLNLGKGRSISCVCKYAIYREEVKMVQDALDKSKIDLKELFLNYIDMKPEFCKSFIPLKHIV